MFRKKLSFTLLELILVTAVIGILAGMALIRFPATIQSAERSEAVASMAEIRHAELAFEIENGGFTNNFAILPWDVPQTSVNYNYGLAGGGGTITATHNGAGNNWQMNTVTGAVTP